MQEPSLSTRKDSTSISALYQQYAASVFSYLHAHSASREDAEDLLVEIFLAALESPSFLQMTAEHQRLWIWRVAHNKVADIYRTPVYRSQLRMDELTDEIQDSEGDHPELVAERNERYVRLHHHIQTLPNIQQYMLRLRFVYGMRCNEIAEQMGKKHGAIRTQLSRTLNTLRSIYEKD